MRIFMACITALGIAACGADGEPVTPTRDATITLSDAGVSGMARVGVNQGPVTVTMGVGL
ncbi:hypothetical protein Z946_2525 [Sulfitobacter noctilucicola]|uniref:Uncharacterized protein n=1 Tax=Sulfitobacter noctilucicola TaxID=1342301 RepID=A0A7W6M9B4_9RHOB|nr:hypothetical protein [Sulfitobacter noctilucicola]KIN63652.1 hypothetical protein Z946_2525 [Sulfitobacter noctilucicola]MBB4174838.1 hypothetical protein [Sulfitobacter noctilucicola]